MNIEANKTYRLSDAIGIGEFAHITKKVEFAKCLEENGLMFTPERVDVYGVAYVTFPGTFGGAYEIPESIWDMFEPVDEEQSPASLAVYKNLADYKNDECNEPIFNPVLLLNAKKVSNFDSLVVEPENRNASDLLNFITNYIMVDRPKYIIRAESPAEKENALWKAFELHQRKQAVDHLINLIEIESRNITQELKDFQLKEEKKTVKKTDSVTYED